VIHTQEPQAALNAPSHLIAGKLTSLKIAVRLGGDYWPWWRSTTLAQDYPNAPLALAVTIRCGGVEEGDGAVQGRANGGQRLFFSDAIFESL
jgi:hypothetical protein